MNTSNIQTKNKTSNPRSKLSLKRNESQGKQNPKKTTIPQNNSPPSQDSQNIPNIISPTQNSTPKHIPSVQRPKKQQKTTSNTTKTTTIAPVTSASNTSTTTNTFSTNTNNTNTNQTTNIIRRRNINTQNQTRSPPPVNRTTTTRTLDREENTPPRGRPQPTTQPHRPTDTQTSPVAGTSRGIPPTVEDSSEEDGSARGRRPHPHSVGGDGCRRQRARETNNELLTQLTQMRQEDGEHRRQLNQMWERYINLCERQARNREEEMRYFHQWMERQDALNNELSGHMLRLVLIMNEAVNQDARPPAYPPACCLQGDLERFSTTTPEATRTHEGDGPLRLDGLHGAFRPPGQIIRPAPVHANNTGRNPVPPDRPVAPVPNWAHRTEPRVQHQQGRSERQGFVRERQHHMGGQADDVSQGAGQMYAGVGVGRILHQRDSDEESVTF